MTLDAQGYERIVTALNAFMAEYHLQINGFLGLVILTCVGTMIYHITNLGISGAGKNGGAEERSKAIKGILVSGIGLATLGSIALVFNILFATTQGV